VAVFPHAGQNGCHLTFPTVVQPPACCFINLITALLDSQQRQKDKKDLWLEQILNNPRIRPFTASDLSSSLWYKHSLFGPIFTILPSPEIDIIVDVGTLNMVSQVFYDLLPNPVRNEDRQNPCLDILRQIPLLFLRRCLG